MLKRILEQPAAATFLVTKIYRFFVNEVPNPAHVAPLAVAFRQSGYDIADLMEHLFSADWFYEPARPCFSRPMWPAGPAAATG